MNVSKIAIVGPGLLGGSLALALRARQPSLQISLWARRESAIAEVRDAGLGEIASTDLAAVVADAQLVVLCVPIGSMAALAEKIAQVIAPETVVTDVGSVKLSVVEKLSPIFAQGGTFIGSHPMAGSEQSGLAAARVDLFEGAACIITPEPTTQPLAIKTVRELWEMLGGRVQILSPADHDEIIARVSHLPHLLAAALVNLAVAEHPHALDFSGPGFCDTTRIASGPPAMWAEIFEQNRAALAKSVNAMIENLRDVLKLLDTADARSLEGFLTEAKQRRDTLKRNKK